MVPTLTPNDDDPPDTVLDYRAAFDCEPRMAGRYQIGRVLGAGRLGPVYDAWHVDRWRHAVVKIFVIEEHEGERLQAERTLLKRLEVLARLSHPALAPMREIGLVDEGLFVAFDTLPGRTLEDALASGWRPGAAQSVSIVRTLASVLDLAHAAGVVHGNLHAGQVMLAEDGSPMLMDLGLVRAAQGLAQVHDLPPRLGDRACMAPELRALGKYRPAGDVHALGVLLLRMLLSERRFVEIAHAQLQVRESGGLWTPIDQVRPGVPPALSAWIAGALEPDPSARPQTRGGPPEALDFAPADAADGRRGPAVPAPARKLIRRRWLVAGTLASSAAMSGLLQSRPVSPPAMPPSAFARTPAPTAPVDFGSHDDLLRREPPAAGPAGSAAPPPEPPRLRMDP